MASCFDFRMRASSFDMHQLAQRHKLAKFSKLFRSKSDTNVKTSSPGNSPMMSPKGSPRVSPGGSPCQQPRRRFMRVVRDAAQEGEEYENPHVIRRYTQEYVEQKYTNMHKSLSLDESRKTLPYEPVPQEDSILKKGLSLDTSNVSDSGSQTGERSPPAGNKHASFSDEVEVIEFDRKDKVKKCICLTHKEKLHDDSDSDFLEESDECEMHNKENTAPPPDEKGTNAPSDTADVKALKDSSLKNIVNSEKAVDRADSSSDSELEPIKKSSRLDSSDDDDVTTSKLALLTRKDEDFISAKKHLAGKTVTEDDAMATSITKVHINNCTEEVIPEEDVNMVKAEL